jgi:transcriptional regulator with XRE-family HTH domain
MDLGAAIRAKLDARGWNQARLAEESGVSEVAISKIVTGATADPQLETITRIAHALGETVGALLGEKGFDLDAAGQQRLRELIDWAGAKLGAVVPPLIEARPNAVELTIISDKNPSKSPDAAAIPGLLKRDGANRVFRASGDSMIPAGILDDDYLFVRDAGVPRMGAGKIVVCTVKGETFVKKLEMTQRRIRLISADARYAPIEVARADISFVGVVLGRLGRPR